MQLGKKIRPRFRLAVLGILKRLSFDKRSSKRAKYTEVNSVEGMSKRQIAKRLLKSAFLYLRDLSTNCI